MGNVIITHRDLNNLFIYPVIPNVHVLIVIDMCFSTVAVEQEESESLDALKLSDFHLSPHFQIFLFL